MTGPRGPSLAPASTFSRVVFKDGRVRPALRALLYVLAAVVGVGFIAAIIFSIAVAIDPRPSRLELIVLQVIATVIVVASLSYALRCVLDRRSAQSLGFALDRGALRLFCLGALLGAGMQTVVVAIEMLFGAGRIAEINATGSSFVVLIAGAAIFIPAALSEELSLRGYILQNLWEEWGFVPAAILSSLAFALLHFANPHVHEQIALTAASLVMYGLWACLSVLWTRSLWLALGCHAAWNLFEGPVYGFPVSGISVPARTVLHLTGGGPDWLTGASFGPEGGMSSIIAILWGAAALWILFKRGAFAHVADHREAYARVSE